MVRLAERKFGRETAKELGVLLETVSGSGRLAEITDLIIDGACGEVWCTRRGADAGDGPGPQPTEP